eukprot:TRINITY_DN3111_c0_g1_i1.p1 TRINITY_DN3111_c0_g1~~TRINITY_DN3111_c0_g1_i1.p1  ORF type:complete len:1416 (+),score=225.02 TRINITY_DN3111_c0_g1_i1:104-4351(+)
MRCGVKLLLLLHLSSCSSSGNLTAAESLNLTCPQLWTLSKGACFKYSRELKSFSSAAERCSEFSANATLAKVLSIEQNEAAGKLITSSGGSDAWIGLRWTWKAPSFVVASPDGCCRTASNGDGSPTRTTGETRETCEARCAQNSACQAYEYMAASGECEIHSGTGSGAITHGSGGSSCTCYIVKKACPRADFSQINIADVQAQGVIGTVISSGIIFAWVDDGFRKMVHTNSAGVSQKAGYVSADSSSWTDPSTWTDNPGYYTLSNVQLCKAQVSWTDGSDLRFTPSSYTKPFAGQECTMLNASTNQGGSWSRSSCDTERGFLCSMPAVRADLPRMPTTTQMTTTAANSNGTLEPKALHVIRYGNPNNENLRRPLVMCQSDDFAAEVRCCATPSTNSTKVDMFYGCHESKTFSEAKAICESNGLRLCTSMEIQQCRTCDTGCGFNSRRVWTSTLCYNETQPTPTPSPATPTPSPTPSPTLTGDSEGTTTITTHKATTTTRTAVSSQVKASDNPISDKVAAKVEEQETNLRNQLLSSNQSYATVSVEGANISVQKLDANLVGNDTENISVAVEGTSAAVLVPVKLLQQFRDPVILQVTAFEDVLKVAEGDPDVRGMVSVNLFSSGGDRLKVDGLEDEIVIRLTVNATEGATCAYWDVNQSRWSSEGLRQLSIPGSLLVCGTSHLTLFGAMWKGFSRAMECSQGHLFSEMGFRELVKGTWYQHAAIVVVWCMLSFLLLMFLVAWYLDRKRAEDGVWDDSVFIVLTASIAEPTIETLSQATEELSRAGRCWASFKAFMSEYVWPVLDPMWQEIVGNLGDAYSLLVDFLGGLRDLLLEEPEDVEGGSNDEEDKPRCRSLCSCRCRWCCKLCLGWRALLSAAMSKILLTVVKLRASTRLMISVADVQLLCDKPALETVKSGSLSLKGHVAVAAESNLSKDKPTMDRDAERRDKSEFALTSTKSTRRREEILSRKEYLLHSTLPNVLTECRSCRSLAKTFWQIFVAKNPWLSVLHCSISQPAVLSVLLSASLWLGDMAIIALFFSTDSSSSVSKRSNRNSACQHDGFFESFGALLAVSVWSCLASMVPCWILGTLHRRSFVEFDEGDSAAHDRQLRIWRRRDGVLFVVGTLYCGTCLLFVMTFHAHVTEADGIKWLYSVIFSVGSEFLVVPLVIALFLGTSAHIAARNSTIRQQAVTKLGCDALEADQQDAGKTHDREGICLTVQQEEGAAAAPDQVQLPGSLPDAGEEDLQQNADGRTIPQDGAQQESRSAGYVETNAGSGDGGEQPAALVPDGEEATFSVVSVQSASEEVETSPEPETLLEKAVEAIDRDGDGTLDVHEVHRALQSSARWSSMTEEQKRLLKESFALIDTNKSGFIELRELKTALVALGTEEAVAEMIFREMDTNRDKRLCLQEFLALVT